MIRGLIINDRVQERRPRSGLDLACGQLERVDHSNRRRILANRPARNGTGNKSTARSGSLLSGRRIGVEGGQAEASLQFLTIDRGGTNWTKGCTGLTRCRTEEA
jgi:hypothetical protein